jgi:hypothetical protein
MQQNDPRKYNMALAPVRFPGGVTNVANNTALAFYPQTDPTRLCVYFDEFHTYTSANWTKTSTGAGTVAVNTGETGGVLLLTNSTGNTDANQIQLINETFKYVAGKQFWIKARFALTATMANFGAFIGLSITDTSVLASAPSDLIGFRKDSGGSTLTGIMGKNSTETSVSLGTVTTATYQDVTMYHNGKDETSFFVNDVKVGSSSTLSNIVDDEELAVTIATINATTGAANVMSVDYLLCAFER